MTDLSFFRGRRVFVTGHTGFKGGWLCKILALSKADVCGYALSPNTSPNFFELSGVEKDVFSVIGDIRDLDRLYNTFKSFSPEIVFHLAAQPIVKESYLDPAGTYSTNVMGTVNILECVRKTGTVRSFLNITTDKVYKNNEWPWGYRETDPLDGFDPYSNSKSCSELITKSYNRCFFTDKGIAVSTARAGNVIGGGDFAADRIIPDCIRAAEENIPISVRNPNSTRPYQHVLEPLFAYLAIAEAQYKNPELAGSYNIGPDENGTATTGELTSLFCDIWGENAGWEKTGQSGPHEAGFLRLDSSLIKTKIGWKPKYSLYKAVEKTVEWTKAYLSKEDMAAVTLRQISEYFTEQE